MCVDAFMQDKLSNISTGFRKNHSTQHCLMYMLEHWKNMLDKGGYVCAMFMDLSKASGTINHDLMITKFGAYGFSQDALQYMGSYLTNRQQRVRVNSNFSTWENIIDGVPQGSILGPLLFNIFINYLFLFVSNSYLGSCADDNNLYAIGYNLEEIKNILRFDFDLVLKWFEENYVVLTADKCHIMCPGKDTENETFIFNNFIFNNSNEEKILGITIDNKLSFKRHIKTLCKKAAAQKKGALSRLLNHLSDSQKRLIFNSIIKSQFNYCPLTWMFCSRTSNNMIKKIHEWALILILNDHTSDFDTLLQNNSDTCNHHRNIQILMVEIYKIKNNLNPSIMDFVFERRNNKYNLRTFQEFATKRKRIVKMGLETLNYRSPQLCSILPENLRQINSLAQIEESVRKWDCIDCPCRLCKLYLPNIGFL